MALNNDLAATKIKRMKIINNKQSLTDSLSLLMIMINFPTTTGDQDHKETSGHSLTFIRQNTGHNTYPSQSGRSGQCFHNTPALSHL
jgi:hypothetical protein